MCNLVQTNDTTKFFRERILQIALRILRAEAYVHKFIINSESDSIKSLIENIKQRFGYKQSLTDILMTKIRHYELVNPLEIATFDRILKLENSMLVDDENFNIDQFLSVYDSSFLKLLSEMREEPV